MDQVRDPGSFSGTPNAVELGWHYYLAQPRQRLRLLRLHRRRMRARRRRAVQRGAQCGSDPRRQSRRRHHAADGIPAAAASVESRRHELRRAIRLQDRRRTNTDFWIWTYAYDVSGITNVSLLFRVNGTNPPTSDEFKTYAGGPLAGAWQTTSMTQRVTRRLQRLSRRNTSRIIITAKVTGISNAFVDYYVSATDALRQYLQVADPARLGRACGGPAAVRGGGSSGPVSRVAPHPGRRQCRDDSIRRHRPRHRRAPIRFISTSAGTITPPIVSPDARDDVQFRLELVAIHRHRFPTPRRA